MTKRDRLIVTAMILVLLAVCALFIELFCLREDFGSHQETRQRLTPELLGGMDSTSKAGSGTPADIPARRFEEGSGEVETTHPFGTVKISTVWADGVSPAVGITVKGRGDSWSQERRSDEHGEMLMTEIPEGNASFDLDRGPTFHLIVEAGKVHYLPITIPPGTEVAGRVLSPAGVPVAGAVVWLSSYGNARSGSVVARTSPEGRWSIRSVGDARTVSAFADGYGPTPLVGISPTSGTLSDLILVLRPTQGLLRGFVVSDRDEPMKGVEVHIEHLEDLPVELQDGGSLHGAPPLVLTTDADGRFQSSAIGGGRMRCWTRIPGWANSEAFVTVEKGLVGEAFLRVGRGGKLEGIIQTLDGNPAPRADIVVECGEQRHFEFRLTCDSLGRYETSALPSGKALVRARAPGMKAAEGWVVIREGETSRWDAKLVVDRLVEGRVVDESGNPMPHWIVEVARPKLDKSFRGIKTSRTDEEGRFSIGCGNEEVVDLWVYPPRAAPPWAISGRSEVRPPLSEIQITVAISDIPSSSLSGSIAQARARERDWLALVAGVGRPDFLSITIDKATGEFASGPLPPGDYRLLFVGQELGGCEFANLRIEASDRKLLGACGLPAEGLLQIELDPAVDLSAMPASLRLAASLGVSFFGGFWQISCSEHRKEVGVLPGEYDLSMSDHRWKQGHHRVQVRSGEVTRVIFTRRKG